MSNIAIHQPTQAQLNAMPLLASVQYYDPRPASSINRLLNGLFPDALYEEFSVLPSASGLAVTVQATDGLALVKTSLGEMIKVHGQHDIDKAVTVGTQYVYLIANFAHNAITKQVDTSSAINPADIVVSKDPLDIGLLLAKVTVPTGKTKVEPYMINFDNVKRFNFSLFARQADFLAHNHDGRYLPMNGKAKSAITADTFANQPPSFYAKSSQVLTDVPANAVFTDTQRPLSNSVASTSESTAATSKAVKTAYDKGEQALSVANGKLDQDEKAADSDKLDGQHASYFAKAADVKTPVPAGAVFTDTQRPLSSSVTSTSTSTAATSNAAKTAYDRGTEALNKANTKLDSGATAVNSDKLDGQHASYFAKAADVKTPVPEGAKFTDTNTWRGVVNDLLSTSTTTSLSANQGRVLKGMIDQLTALVSSDDTTLDEIQEIVDFIKQNKDTLDSLAINNIAGLQAALDSKFDKSSAINYAHKNQKNTLTETLQLDSVGDALVIGGTGKLNDADASIYIGNSIGNFGYRFTYKGSGSGNSNAFEITSTNSGNGKSIFYSNQDGIVNLPQLGAKVAGNVIWHAGNDGAGSGLDADKLDGLQGSQFLRSDTDDITQGSIKIHKDQALDDLAAVSPSDSGQIRVTSGNNGLSVGLDSTFNSRKAWIQVGHESSTYPAGELQGTLELNPLGGQVFANGGLIWHEGNDGAGSGLDADKLDGQHASYFAKAADVKTPVPAGAVFTDTQRPLSNSVASTSTTVAATSKAAKTAYDRGTEALNKANTKLDEGATAANSNKLDGQQGSYYAKAADVKTPVPAGAVFTDTQRPLSSSVTSTSTSTAATSNAAKTAYDRGTEALNKANTKLDSGATAVNASKLGNKSPSDFVQTTGDQAISGKKTFNTEIGLSGGAAIKFDAETDSIVFMFD